MDSNRDKPVRTKTVDKMLSPVYRPRHMISLHYADKHIELERAFRRLEKLIVMLGKQQLQRCILEMSPSKSDYVVKSNAAVVTIIGKLSIGLPRAVLATLRRSVLIEQKMIACFMKLSTKRVIRDLKIFSKSLKSIRQSWVILDRLLKRQQARCQLTAFCVMMNFKCKAKVEVNKNYEIGFTNEIARQARMSFRMELTRSVIENNYATFQHRNKLEDFNQLKRSQLLLEKLGQEKKSSFRDSPRSFSDVGMLRNKNRDIVDEAQPFTDPQSFECSGNEFISKLTGVDIQISAVGFIDQLPIRSTEQLSTIGQCSIIEGDYYQNQKPIKDSVICPESSIDNMDRKATLKKPLASEWQDRGHTRMLERHPSNNFQVDTDEFRIGKRVNQSSTDKIVSALADIQEKLEKLTASQNMLSLSNTSEIKAVNRSFIVLDRNDLKPRNRQVDNSYTGYYVETSDRLKSDSHNNMPSEYGRY